MAHENDDELHFRPTGGPFMGGLAIAVALVVVGSAVFDPGSTPVEAAAGAVLFAVVSWAAMLWPRLSVTAHELVMRNTVSIVRVPLAAIEDVVIRQVLAVRVGDKRYVSSAVGRSRRKTVASDKSRTPHRVGLGSVTNLPHDAGAKFDYADFVEQEIRNRMERARAPAGITPRTAEHEQLTTGVRRQPAWLPIGLIAAATLGLGLAVLL